MSMPTVAVGLVSASLLVGLAVPDAEAQNKRIKLSGFDEVPVVVTGATGELRLSISQDEFSIDYVLTVMRASRAEPSARPTSISGSSTRREQSWSSCARTSATAPESATYLRQHAPPRPARCPGRWTRRTSSSERPRASDPGISRPSSRPSKRAWPTPTCIRRRRSRARSAASSKAGTSPERRAGVSGPAPARSLRPRRWWVQVDAYAALTCPRRATVNQSGGGSNGIRHPLQRPADPRRGVAASRLGRRRRRPASGLGDPRRRNPTVCARGGRPRASSSRRVARGQPATINSPGPGRSVRLSRGSRSQWNSCPRRGLAVWLPLGVVA